MALQTYPIVTSFLLVCCIVAVVQLSWINYFILPYINDSSPGYRRGEEGGGIVLSRSPDVSFILEFL